MDVANFKKVKYCKEMGKSIIPFNDNEIELEYITNFKVLSSGHLYDKSKHII